MLRIVTRTKLIGPIVCRLVCLALGALAASGATGAGWEVAAPVRVDLAGTSCVTSESILCLGADRRYRVRAEWRLTDGTTGQGTAVALTSDTGAFHFFDASNLEVVVKVLDGCDANGRVWIFGTGLTDVGVVLVVRDLVTDETVRYVNDAGDPFRPIRDTDALGGCAGGPPQQSGGLADRSRQMSFSLAVEQTAGDVTGRALCNPALGNQQWRSAIDFSVVDGPDHELWRLCTCPQIEGECATEAEAAIEQLDARRNDG